MKLYIITATFNSRDTILNCIDSAHDQCSDYTHIFIDGGSSDDTPELIKSRMRSWDVLVSEQDFGIYDALNKALGFCEENSIVGILHSDDVYGDKNVHNAVKYRFRQHQCDVVYGDVSFTSRTNLQKVHRYWSSKYFDRSKLGYGAMPPHPAMFIKSDVWKSAGQFDTNYTISADYDFIIRLNTVSSKDWIHSSDVNILMRLGGKSTKDFTSFWRKTVEDFEILKSHNVKFPLWVVCLKKLRKIPQHWLINLNL